MVETVVARLALDIGINQLSGQKEDLRNLRNQASLSAAISGLIATVFATILGSDRAYKITEGNTFVFVSLEGWLVLATFSASIALSILVVIGWGECNFEVSPKWVIGQNKSGDTDSEIFEKLAVDCEKYFDGNERVINGAKSNLWWSLVLSWVQIPAWILLIV